MMMIIALVASLALIGQPFEFEHQDGQQQKQEQKPPRHNPLRTYQLKDLDVQELKIGEKLDQKFKCWVMDVPGKRQEGMMFLQDQDVAKDQGMIFVFKEAEVQRFWMMNTYIPLDIAYISAEGYIVKTYTMRARDIDTNYTSIRPAKYVLEVRSGTFKRLGVKVGQKVQIPKEVKAKDRD